MSFGVQTMQNFSQDLSLYLSIHKVSSKLQIQSKASQVHETALDSELCRPGRK